MSRNEQRIRKACKTIGYKVKDVHWEPIGMMFEMMGREGGWFIDGFPVGHNVDEVLEFVRLEGINRIMFDYEE